MKYIFSAIFKQEIGGYSVLCPELGVASQGKTIKEAENNIHEAVELYINDMSKNDLESYARSLNEVPMVKTFEVSHV
ncbi:MAG TPA: type II toxin-antitoxin system HicB family antitoxin [Candidatus Paceibacterota bacterium]